MSISSLLADSITRIRNAQMVKHSSVVVRSSNLVKSVMSVLKDEGYILDFEEFEERKGIKFINVYLKYYRGRPVIQSISMCSKPGLRCYVGVKDIPKSKNGFGVYVLSTSKGIISDRVARDANVAGELLFEVF